MKTYLVTGAAGFIGSAIARKIIHQGNNVVTIDNLSTGSVDKLPDGITFINGDCQDPEIIKRLEGYNFEAIYHIAGQSSGEISFENPIYDLQTNAQSTLQLLNLAKKINCNKFIYASTMSIYGDVLRLPVTEDIAANPKSFYGVGKLASESYLQIFANQFKMSTASLRLFNVYGPGQSLTNMKQGMVSIFLSQAINSNHIHVKGSGKRFRDFIYIDDVVRAFLETENSLEPGEHLFFNVCSGVKTTVRELVESICNYLDSNISSKYEGNTPGDQFGIYGNPEKMHKIIGDWRKTEFQKGIEAFIKSIT
jgi:UDP-glucose 4-epimerase